MISVVIPALNEENGIALTVRQVSKVLTEAKIQPFEIIVVNDGSTDNTAGIAEQNGARVVSHLYNLGYGRSLKDGILAATFDTIAIVDADGTYPINQLPTFFKYFQDGFDLVVGRRQGANYAESWLKRPLRAILKFLVEFTAGQSIPDINSGMRVFSRRTLIPYFDQLCNTFSFTTSQTLAYILTGKFVGYLPIEYHERIGQKKVRLFKDSLRTLQYIVQAALYYNPLKIFLLLSLATGFLASAVLVLGLFGKIVSACLLGVGGLLVALVIFSLGLLSDQIRQILIKIQYKNHDGNVVRGNVIVSDLRKVGSR